MKKLTIFLIAFCLLNTTYARATSEYCIENERIAKEAARSAADREAWIHRGKGAGISGVGCAVFLLAAVVDGGLTTFLCTAVGTAVGAASVDPDAVAKVYNETYKKYKDFQCPSVG